MNIAIVGSRDHSSYTEVGNLVRRLAAKYPDATILSGGCRGVDQWAANTAKGFKLATIEYPVYNAAAGYWIQRSMWWPDGGAALSPQCNNVTGEGYYPTFTRAAMVRNERIAREADVVVALWDGLSRGTKATLDFAAHHETFALVYRAGAWLSVAEAQAQPCVA